MRETREEEILIWLARSLLGDEMPALLSAIVTQPVAPLISADGPAVTCYQRTCSQRKTAVIFKTM